MRKYGMFQHSLKKGQKYQQSGEGWGTEISVTNKSLWEAKVNKIFIAGCSTQRNLKATEN